MSDAGEHVTTSALDRLEDRCLREIEHLKELHKAERDADHAALRLQAVEYERRLENVNNENGRLAAILEQSIPRETFDNYKQTEATAKEQARREQQAWKESVDAKMTASAASTKTWVTAIGIVFTLMSLASRFWKP